MIIRGRRCKAIAGICILALSVGVRVVGCSPGGPDLSELGGVELSELRPGDCITGDMTVYPTDIEVVDCAEADPLNDHKVVFVESMTGDSYPGNFGEIEIRCLAEAAPFFLPPSPEAWDDGDRSALCYTPLG